MSAPGTVSSTDDHDEWTAAPGVAPVSAPLVMELVPDTVLLRNRVFARLRAYCYQPNPAAALALLGLAALTLSLARRRRPVAAAGPP